MMNGPMYTDDQYLINAARRRRSAATPSDKIESSAPGTSELGRLLG